MQSPETASKTRAEMKQQVRLHFGGLATEYHHRNYVGFAQRGKYPDIYIRHRHILTLVDRKEAGRTLEIGVGGGQMMVELCARGHRAYGVDLSPEMAVSAGHFLASRTPSRATTIAAADVEQLCFGNGGFDLVVAAGVIEYLPDTAQALSEITRVLRVGGIAILSVRNRLCLGRPLIAIRDLLAGLPAVGVVLQFATTYLRSLRRRDGDRQKIFVRRDLPWRFRQDLRRHGLLPLEQAFYHFSVFPPSLERRFPRLCISIGMMLECLSGTFLGYLGRGFIVRARKM